MESGYSAEFGGVKKDVVTEASAQEFKDWLAIKGININFMSDATLNGFHMGKIDAFFQWEIRMAFMRDVENMTGEAFARDEAKWQAYAKEYDAEMVKRYGPK